jgi:hypothetical protein
MPSPQALDTAGKAHGGRDMKHFNFVTGLLLGAALMATTATAQENYSTWGQHKFVTLDTRATAANVSSTVTGIPVLVRLTASNFSDGFTQSSGRGADLRFTKVGDAVRLPYQIERWDSASKKAEIWVLVDTVKGGTVTSLRMHWAKPGAADSSRGSAVFGTAQGYQAVMHMNGAGTGNEQDATANAFTATAVGSPTGAEGVIGRARVLSNPTDGASGSGQYFVLENSAGSNLNFPVFGSYTLSAWVHSTGSGSNGKVIVGKGDTQYALQINQSTLLECVEFQGGVGWNYMTVQPPAEGEWHHVTYVRSGESMFLYMDGDLVADAQQQYGTTDGRNENFNVSIGTRLLNTTPNGSGNNRGWVGSLDEIRLLNTERSPAQVKLEFQNQRAAQSLVSFSDTVVAIAADAGAGSHGASRLGVKNLGAGYSFAVDGTSAGTRLSLVDMQGRTVWSRLTDAAGRATWDGNVRGRKASAGLYVLQASIPAANGNPGAQLVRKIPVAW